MDESLIRYKEFEDIQNHLDKLISLKFKIDREFDSWKNVIKHAINNTYTVNNSTVYSTNNKFQCSRNRYRGIADLYRIVHYYFPEVELKTVYDYVRNNQLITFCSQTFQNVVRDNLYDNRGLIPTIRISNKYYIKPIIK